MAIGVVSDEDFQRELESLISPNSRVSPTVFEPSAVVIDKPTKGRDEGDVNVPDSLRQIIGEDALINGRQSAIGLAGMFGISPSSVSAYAKGATSTTSYDKPSPTISAHISRSRERAIRKASKTLNLALGSISQEKLDYTDAKDLSVIAKNMSAVIKDLEPEKVVDPIGDAPKTQFIVYAPQFRDERSFETINVVEEQ